MITIQQIHEKIKNTLSDKKYRHSIVVKDIAILLARKYGVNEQKAEIAGLVHDCAKYLTCDEMLNLANKFGILIDEVQGYNISTLHAVVGACIAEAEFGITDPDILEAIKYHTTGCKDMGLLSKVVYVADYIDESRNFNGVDKIRELAFEDLDSAVLAGMDLTIQFIISTNRLLHPDTVIARNDILLKRKKETT